VSDNPGADRDALSPARPRLPRAQHRRPWTPGGRAACLWPAHPRHRRRPSRRHGRAPRHPYRR